jgi:hypothetical protein
MSLFVRSLTLAVAMLAMAGLAKAADAPAGGKKKVVFLAGGPSHGFAAHDHKAGCMLLAKRINEVPGFTAEVSLGWPKDESIFDGAAAVIMYSDGGGGHFAATHLPKLNELSDKGVGIGAIHYAVEVVKGPPGDTWLKTMGGFFEINWSVNPHWEGQFKTFPQHPVSSGVMPFTTNDEWYYNMRFRDNMEGVTGILSAIPPDKTRQGKDDAHGGNPEVRKGIGKNQSEIVLWVSENKNGSRGFGTTGGHFHRNWCNDQFRKTVLNSIVWIAKGEVPAKGIESKRPEVEEMLSNYDEKETPTDKQKEDLKKQIEELNKQQDGKPAARVNRPAVNGELMYEVSSAR